MRTTLRLALLSLIAPLLVPLAVVATTAPAEAVYSTYANDGVYSIGLSGFSDLVVDEPVSKVFVSDGTQIVVTDLAGAVQQTLSPGSPASQMARSDDGATIFTVDAETGAVQAIDASSYAVTSDSLPSGVCPASVAYSAGVAWVLDACAGAAHSILALDPATLAVLAGFSVDATVDRITADPSVPDALFSRDTATGVSQYQVHRFDVSGGASPTLALAASRTLNTPTREVAVSPGGPGVLVATTGHVETLDPSTLGVASSISTSCMTSAGSSCNPNAVAGRADGEVSFSSTSISTVSFLLPGTSKAQVFDLPDGHYKVLARSMRSGTTLLYAALRIKRKNASTQYRLLVVTPAKVSRVSVTTKPSVGDPFRYGKKITAIAHLELPKNTPGQAISIYVKPVGKRRHLVASGVTSDYGRFKAAFKATRNATVIAEFPGNDDYAPSSAALSFQVRSKVVIHMVHPKDRVGKYALYDVSKPARAKVKVYPNHRGECVGFGWDLYSGGAWHHAGTVKCVTLNRRSVAVLRLHGDSSVVGVRFRIYAGINADAVNQYGHSKDAYFRFVS